MKAGIIMMLVLILVTNVYVVWRMYQILPTPWLKIAVPFLYVLTLLTYIGCFMTIMRPGLAWAIRVNTALSPILVIYLYSLLVFLIVDLGCLVRLIPKDFAVNSAVGSAAVFGTIALLLAIGAVNYRVKHREAVEMTTGKVLEKPLKIVMASDLHLGYNNPRKTLARWIDMINAEHPDLMIFGGDIIDVSTVPLFEDNFAAEFHRLEAPAYAVFGNHEFISGAGQSMKFYEEAGINLLRDSIVHTKGIVIVGRDDLYADHSSPSSTAESYESADNLHPSGTSVSAESSPVPGISSRRRKSVSQLTEGIGHEEFTILIDHQPYHLEEAEAAGIDFQFSGHTHRGQVWPVSLLTDFMYEKSWGHHQRGATRYYISSGLGIWGPKFRIGSRSEYLVLTVSSLKFL